MQELVTGATNDAAAEQHYNPTLLLLTLGDH
jgi:hypothetical protein